LKNSFSINIIFLLLSIIGLALIPRLPVQLHPTKTGDAVYVSYQWYGMGPEVIEKEVTSPIEGVLSAMRGLQGISSNSYNGRGDVSLTFKKGTDMDAARFEVSSLMRGLHSRLPQGVQLPQVSYRWAGSEDDPMLLVYTVNGEGTGHVLQQYVERYISPRISNMADISKVMVSGAAPMEWEITYDKELLNQAGFNVTQLQNAIRNHLNTRELGNGQQLSATGDKTIRLAYKSMPGDSLIWDDVILGKQGSRIIRLTDLAQPKLQEMQPGSYFRVNGLNTIYLIIHSAKGSNQVDLAAKVNAVVRELQPAFPPNFSMLVNYDASKEIRLEVEKISSRAFLAIVILLLFVLVVSRNWRYLLIIALSLLANLSIAAIFYYLLGIEIHLYSLAGITVSLGMIIDNTIIMADHLRRSGNSKAFLAILAATLTTMGAMVVIFFLKEDQRLNLVDFAIVMLVNLSISLAVALLLVPALMDQLPISSSNTTTFIRRKKRVVQITKVYGRFLSFAMHRRWAFMILVVWAFGLPTFLLPDKLEVEKDIEAVWYQTMYNKTLGNQFFTSSVKPWVNRIFGGSWYYFSSYYSSGNMNWDKSRTRLYARGTMPDGSSIHQMNDVFIGLENYLTQYKEIEQFTSTIYSIDYATLEITFTKEAETGPFPHVLKNMLIQKANETGSADFSIWGVGLGFSNDMGEQSRNNRIEFTGYNYELILKMAGIYRDTLLQNPRIQEVILQTGNAWRGKPRYGFVMGVEADKLEETGSSLGNVYQNLLYQAPNDAVAGSLPSRSGVVTVNLREKRQGKTSVWDMHNNLLSSEFATFRLKNIGFLNRERTGDVIRKENQEYQLMVEYDFIGPWELNRRVRDRYLEQINAQLPIGFSAIDKSQGGGWNTEETSQYWLLLIVTAVVFFLCAILFESLWQPLAVVTAIPVSFIGLFLTFAIFKIKFDQGGYAAMILLCGLTVNSALYIINDFNNLRKSRRIGTGCGK
jgi:multidrug efflux pump subunit AcrB